MSQYATIANLATVMTAKELTGISSDNQTTALQRASAKADGYLVTKYRMPITAYGDDLTRCVCDIAAYDLLSAKALNPQAGPWNVRTRYDDAISWLKDIARGIVTPSGITDSSSTSQPRGNQPRVRTSDTRGW